MAMSDTECAIKMAAAKAPFRLLRVQDHPVLESEARFSIILRLENTAALTL
jgi:hypothetical protein